MTAGVFASPQVDENRQDLEITDGKEMDATRLSRFIQINELRMVTEYNPVVINDLHHPHPASSLPLLLYLSCSYSDFGGHSVIFFSFHMADMEQQL